MFTPPTFEHFEVGDKNEAASLVSWMNKPIHRTTRIPEPLQTRVAEISGLLGYSQNRLTIEILNMGINIMCCPDYGGFPRIVMLARAALLEERKRKASGSKFPLENGAAVLTMETLPPVLQARLQRTGCNGGQMRAIRHLLSSERITRREYEAVAQTPPSTAKRQLAGLVKLGVLAKRGKSRNSWYELENEVKKSNSTKIMSRN